MNEVLQTELEELTELQIELLKKLDIIGPEGSYRGFTWGAKYAMEGDARQSLIDYDDKEVCEAMETLSMTKYVCFKNNIVDNVEVSTRYFLTLPGKAYLRTLITPKELQKEASDIKHKIESINDVISDLQTLKKNYDTYMFLRVLASQDSPMLYEAMAEYSWTDETTMKSLLYDATQRGYVWGETMGDNLSLKLTTRGQETLSELEKIVMKSDIPLSKIVGIRL